MFRVITTLLALIVLNLCFITPASSGALQTSVTVSAVLPSVIGIESFYVDSVEHSKAIKYPNLDIKEVQSVSEELNVIKLSSIQYKVYSNTKNNIKFNAEFIALYGVDYSFDKEKLSIEEKQYNNNENLVTTKVSPEFVPTIKVDSDVPPGVYNGTVLLTISAL